jgi:hypothetical protein
MNRKVQTYLVGLDAKTVCTKSRVNVFKRSVQTLAQHLNQECEIDPGYLDRFNAITLQTTEDFFKILKTYKGVSSIVPARQSNIHCLKISSR